MRARDFGLMVVRQTGSRLASLSPQLTKLELIIPSLRESLSTRNLSLSGIVYVMDYKVFLVEDEPHTREQLGNTVAAEAGLALAGSVGTYGDAMSAVRTIAKSHVLLVDLGLPDGDGVDIIRYVSHLDDPPNILVISVFGDERHVVRAIEAGADGYLLKDSTQAELVESITSVINGDSPINPAIARHLLKRFRPEDKPHVGQGDSSSKEKNLHITPREDEVLKLIGRGFSNAEIAELLEVSLYTVTSHIKHLYKKLAVSSRSEAIFEAVQLGLLELSRSED